MRAYTGRPENNDRPVSSQLQFRAYYVRELASRRTECKLAAGAWRMNLELDTEDSRQLFRWEIPDMFLEFSDFIRMRSHKFFNNIFSQVLCMKIRR